MPLPVLVVGGGVGGLTAGLSIVRSGRQVRILERCAIRGRDRGLGLWGRAQAALRQLGLGSTLDCEQTTLRIPAAAYRSLRGDWLSVSSDTPENRQRVATLLESALLNALEANLPTGSVERGAGVVDVQQYPNNVSVLLDDGRTVDGSILVGADGVDSVVRRKVFAHDGVFAEPVCTGFTSHSGLLLPPSPGAFNGIFERDRPFAFETLSGGRRFALVPLAGGAGFWFATRPLSDIGGQAGGAQPLGGAAAAGELREAYDGWHEPIPQVLHAAACAAAEAAMSRGAASADAMHTEHVRAAPALRRWWRGRAVLVGDAAHALPINLAQGAAASIEGAYLLGVALARSPSAELDETECRAAFESYQSMHEPRVRQCRMATAFTAALAAPSLGTSEAVRNAMRFVPNPLNSTIFDAALTFSLGDWPASTRARWPLGTAG